MARYIDVEKLEENCIPIYADSYDRWAISFFDIDSAPTEDVKPVIHSKWIDGVCENCGYDGGIDAFSGVLDYCGKCGAIMDLKE